MQLISRIRNIVLLLAIISTGNFSHANTDKEILVLGDSLSAAYGIEIDEGWVHLMQLRLQKQNQDWQVRNASISGSTTDNAIFMLQKALEQGTPEIIIIEIGANDGLRGFPLAQIKKNLQALIRTSKNIGAKVLLIGMELPQNYGKVYTSAFSNMYIQLAEEESVQLLPFLLQQVFDIPSLMQEDRLHPTAEAQPIILDTLWRYIEKEANH